MPYIKRQTRVSIVLHPSVSTIIPGYRAWNKNHKTNYSAFLSRLLRKRKPLQKLLAACRVKEETTPHFVTMQQHNVCRTVVACPPRSPPCCSTPPIRACLYYYT